MFEIVYTVFSFVFVSGVVMVGELWLMAQIEPPGGRWWRIFLLVVMITVAMLFGLSATQPTMLPPDN